MAMRINLLTLGSQGDVQPFVALGRGLVRAGHEVTLSTADQFESFVRRHGLGFHPLDGEFLRLQEAKGAMEGGGDKLGLMRKVKPMLRRMLDDAWRGAQNSDMLVYHPKVLAGLDIADALGVPAALAVPAPFVVPTRDFPSAIVPPNWRLGGWFNRLTYALTPLAEAAFADVVNAFRVETLRAARRRAFRPALRRADGRPLPVLHAYSAAVVPRPDDWPAEAAITGYWLLRDEAPWAPSPDLARFLDGGPPPLYVGFGSMTSRDAAEKGRLVVEAVRLAGQRAVLASGWGAIAIAEDADDLLVIEQAPHDRLFPRMGAVCHHGGAGTTAEGLLAGRPSLICPFFGDQPFWGARVQALGVGPQPIPQRELTAPRLAAAMQQAMSDEAMRMRAQALQSALVAE
ncbi:MAG: glycosyltransferase, partial [Candidatus Sericytochromatia bacterium]